MSRSAYGESSIHHDAAGRWHGYVSMGLKREGTVMLDEAFLTQLADTYVDVVSRRLPPAPTLAEEAAVAVRTVHRWISEARKRGHLLQGTRGRAGV